MNTAVQRSAMDADIVVMAAAVADYTPGRRAAGKIEKSDAPLELSLVRTRDILAELSQARGDRPRPVLVGFAAESGDPLERGRQKLVRKGVDLIVANDISVEGLGFDSISMRRPHQPRRRGAIRGGAEECSRNRHPGPRGGASCAADEHLASPACGSAGSWPITCASIRSWA